MMLAIDRDEPLAFMKSQSMVGLLYIVFTVSRLLLKDKDTIDTKDRLKLSIMHKRILHLLTHCHDILSSVVLHK